MVEIGKHLHNFTSCLGPKKQDFFGKNHNTQGKYLCFVNTMTDSMSKIRHDFLGP